MSAVPPYVGLGVQPSRSRVPLATVMVCALGFSLGNCAASDHEVLVAILAGGQVTGDSGAHHLEQHPDAHCRRGWRNADLRVSTPAATGADLDIDIDDFRAHARSLVGNPYRYGATGSGGFDCSGLVNQIFARFGWDLPRSSKAMFQVGVVVERQQGYEDLRPGDLVFFATGGGGRVSHVGILLDPDTLTFIHASSGRRRVVLDKLSARYYRQRYLGARRIFSLPPGRYSSAGGGARPDTLFSSARAARQRFPGVYGPCVANTFAHKD